MKRGQELEQSGRMVFELHASKKQMRYWNSILANGDQRANLGVKRKDALCCHGAICKDAALETVSRQSVPEGKSGSEADGHPLMCKH